MNIIFNMRCQAVKIQRASKWVRASGHWAAHELGHDQSSVRARDVAKRLRSGSSVTSDQRQERPWIESWSKPSGLQGLQHPHDNAGFYQNGTTLFVAGIAAESGDGIYRSTDLGGNWTRIAKDSGGIVWGSTKNLYAMWGWARGGCGLDEGGPQYQTAQQPGDTWSKGKLPAELDWGPNSVAATSDGRHTIFVGSMWATGLWRYVEP